MQFVFRHLRWQLNTIAQQTETRQAYGKISLFLVCFNTDFGKQLTGIRAAKNSFITNFKSALYV